MLGKDFLGKLANKIDEQDDPRKIHAEKVKKKQDSLDEGNVPPEKRAV